MNTLALLLLTGSAIARPNRDEDDTDYKVCVSGTSLGDQLEKAFTSCFQEKAMRHGQARRMERSEDRCYTYQEIMDWVAMEYSDDACVLQSIGWMDDQYNFDNATIMADLYSLDSTVTDPIFDKGEACVKEALKQMEEEYNTECDSLYIDEEAEHLEILAMHIA